MICAVFYLITCTKNDGLSSAYLTDTTQYRKVRYVVVYNFLAVRLKRKAFAAIQDIAYTITIHTSRLKIGVNERCITW